MHVHDNKLTCKFISVPEEIYSDILSLDQGLYYYSRYCYRFMAEMNGDLKHLISLDHLLLPLLVSVCPAGDLPAMFSLIPPFVSASWLRYSISKDYKTLQNQQVSATL